MNIPADPGVETDIAVVRSPPATPFYVVSGTIPLGSQSYVERQADKDLLTALLAGEYCFVLNSRQMGKSSLSVRTMAKLQTAGVKSAFLDLTKIGGGSVTPEQWYIGLVSETGRVLGLRKEFLAYWKEHAAYSLVQRYIGALQEVALPHLQTPLVVFIDEIDAVRSLSFSTDEFFAAIRECYNRRVYEPEYARLTFALVGSATASDLIQDVRASPFNIGRRIELKDFTREEMRPLAAGIDRPNAERLTERAYYWTNGHPFLTQAVCAEIARDDRIKTLGDVDHLVTQIFFEAKSRERNVNLADVSKRILNSYVDPEHKEEYRAAILDLYAKVGSRRDTVADNESDSLVAALKLSGITRSVKGALLPRCRIYARVFDREWIRANLPDTERRRQKEAYRAGMLRAIALSSIVIVALATLAGAAFQNAQRAERLLYPNQIARTQKAIAHSRLRDAQNYLAEIAHPHVLIADMRGFDWRYLLRESRDTSLHTFTGQQDSVTAVAYSPDGATVASIGTGKVVSIWNALTGQQIKTLTSPFDLHCLLFLPDGNTLVTGAEGKAIFWDVKTGTARFELEARNAQGRYFAVESLALSPDGKRLACGLHSGRIDLWNLATLPNHPPRQPERSLLHLPEGDNADKFFPVRGMAFSQDGKMLASGCGDDIGLSATKIWDMRDFKTIAVLGVSSDDRSSWGGVNSVVFSHDGKTLITGSEDHIVRLWDVAKRTFRELTQHVLDVTCVAFSPNGRWLATSSDDGTIKLWDASRLAQEGGLDEVATLHGHQKGVKSVAFSPDGAMLVSGSLDATLKSWKVAQAIRPSLSAHTRRVGALAYSPDGSLLATAGCGGDNQARVWDARTGRQMPALPAHAHDDTDAAYIAFSPDGQTLAVASKDRTLTLCDARTGREVASFEGVHEQLNVVAFSPDGKLLAAGERETWNGPPNNGFVARLWDVATRKEIKEFAACQVPAHRGWILALAFSPDSKKLVTAGTGGELRWWDVEKRQEIGPKPRQINGDTVMSQFAHQKPIRTVAFSPDGRWLATGSEDNTARLWNAATQKPMHLMLGHAGVVFCLAFSGDSRTLATGSKDGTVKLWSLSTVEDSVLQETVTLESRRHGVTSLAFSPDSNTLAVGHLNGTVVFWQADSL